MSPVTPQCLECRATLGATLAATCSSVVSQIPLWGAATLRHSLLARTRRVSYRSGLRHSTVLLPAFGAVDPERGAP